MADEITPALVERATRATQHYPLHCPHPSTHDSPIDRGMGGEPNPSVIQQQPGK